MIIEQWHSPVEYYYEGGMGTQSAVGPQRIDKIIIRLRSSEEEGRQERRDLEKN